MKTQAEYVADAVEARSKMIEGQHAAAQAAIEALVPLFKQDFEHQRFVRGISRDKSIEIVDENAQKFFDQLHESIIRQVFLELDEEGKLHGGL